MIATGKRNIKNGNQYGDLFPSVRGEWITIKESANLNDTTELMKKVVRETLSDTVKIAKRLESETPYKTCARIWDFCYNHFQYQIDEKGKEQIRRPARSWKDRGNKQGIDCDDYCLLIGSILSNLGIPFIWRMTKYESSEYEHIYPIAILGNRQVILDCVVNQFDYEVPFKHKKDITMELQYLNGIPEDDSVEQYLEVMESDLSIDAMDLFGDDLQGLEGRAERQARRKAKRKVRKETKGTFKERAKKVIRIGRRFNPAIALLRAGILVSMKLNIMKVASRLRFSYWTEEQAIANQMNLNTYNSLKRIREKIERTFYNAGGKPENLKKSILTGRGNKNKQVQLHGLGAIISLPSDYDDIRTILGDDIMYDEFDDDGGAISGLGSAVATSASVTAASGILATIANLLKKLGPIFKKASSAAKHLKSQDKSDDAEEKTRKFSFKNILKKTREVIQKRKGKKELKKAGIAVPEELEESVGEELVVDLDNNPFTKSMTIESDKEEEKQKSKDKGKDDDDDDDSEKKGFGNWIKNNIPLAIGIGVVSAAGIGLGVRAIVKSKNKKSVDGLKGAPKKKKKAITRKTTKKRSTTSKRKRTIKSKRRKPSSSKVTKIEIL